MGKTYQSIVVNGPVDKVWAALRDFHDMSWAPNVIKKVTVVGDKKGDQVGARRLLNDVFHETLLDVSDADRTVRYSIDDGPSPISKDDVKGYVGMVRVSPVTEGGATFVEWSSSWEAKGNVAEEFCHGIYVALLNDLKKTFA
ncbi:MAG: SRPBCC family protein [Dehalococcoidia bacterium]